MVSFNTQSCEMIIYSHRTYKLSMLTSNRLSGVFASMLNNQTCGHYIKYTLKDTPHTDMTCSSHRPKTFDLPIINTSHLDTIMLRCIYSFHHAGCLIMHTILSDSEEVTGSTFSHVPRLIVKLSHLSVIRPTSTCTCSWEPKGVFKCNCGSLV